MDSKKHVSIALRKAAARVLAKLRFAVLPENFCWLCGAILALCISLNPAQAQPYNETFVSSAGSDSHTCNSVAQACGSFEHTIPLTAPGGQLTVLTSGDYGIATIFGSISIVNANSGTAAVVLPSGTGCAGQCGLISINAGANDVVTLRGLVLNGVGVSNFAPVQINNAARVNIENCVILNGSPAGILVNPFTGFQQPLAANMNVKIQDTTINSSSTGIKITSVQGVTISAGITRSQIDNNAGGGIRADSSSGGAITTTISDSDIGFNGGNGINLVSGANQNIASIKNSVIAKNGAAGVQANGANAGVLVQTTLFDQNAAGATSVVAGGHISTYGNNSIVGADGSGFTGTAALR
jgi:hypothetical protein